MPFPKGNQYAKNNPNVGTKTKAEIVEQAIVKITSDALIELANSAVHKVLKRANDNGSIILTKEFALPVTLRGMAEKKQIDVGKTLEDILKKFGK